MKLSLQPVSAAMREPLVAGHGAVAARDLLLVSLEAADGVCGYGEAAPLASYDGVSMPAVRAEHLTARARGQTRTPDVTRWLSQLVAERSSLLKAWREQAEEARSRALAAYERARGTGPSLVPEDH